MLWPHRSASHATHHAGSAQLKPPVSAAGQVFSRMALALPAVPQEAFPLSLLAVLVANLAIPPA